MRINGDNGIRNDFFISYVIFIKNLSILKKNTTFVQKYFV